MKSGFRKKLLLTLISTSAVISAGVIAYIWIQLLNVPKNMYSRQLYTAVANAACFFDPADIKTVQQAEDPENTAAWQRLKQKLMLVRLNAPLLELAKDTEEHRQVPIENRRAGIITKDPATGRLTLLTGSPETTGTLDIQRVRKILATGWNTPAAEKNIVVTQHGSVMGAVAPIKDADGQTVAVLAVEMSVGYFRDITNEMLIVAITIFIFAVGASAVIALWFSKRLNRPMRLLADGMEAIARGNTKAYITPIKTGDEFEKLIEQYNIALDVLDERNRMKHSLELARQTQQLLLPEKMPSVCGFDISGRSIYCDETGGDYYDFLEIDNKLLAAVIGDISGHGIATAMLMAAARGVLRSNAWLYGKDLEGLFKTMNNHLCRDTGDDRFMTMFYCLLECENRTINWISAGHDPAFVLRANTDEFEMLENAGIPLGILREAEYKTNNSVKLYSGDIVVAGTDGIWEAGPDKNNMFGKERLKKIIRKSKDATAREIQDNITNAVLNFIGPNPRQDDITLFVIKTLG